MVTLSQPSKFISETVRKATRSQHNSRHHTADVVGWIVLGLAILGVSARFRSLYENSKNVIMSARPLTFV